MANLRYAYGLVTGVLAVNGKRVQVSRLQSRFDVLAVCNGSAAKVTATMVLGSSWNGAWPSLPIQGESSAAWLANEMLIIMNANNGSDSLIIGFYPLRFVVT